MNRQSGEKSSEDRKRSPMAEGCEKAASFHSRFCCKKKGGCATGRRAYSSTGKVTWKYIGLSRANGLCAQAHGRSEEGNGKFYTVAARIFQRTRRTCRGSKETTSVEPRRTTRGPLSRVKLQPSHVVCFRRDSSRARPGGAGTECMSNRSTRLVRPHREQSMRNWQRSWCKRLTVHAQSAS
jgi:hypothetical protein